MALDKQVSRMLVGEVGQQKEKHIGSTVVVATRAATQTQDT